MNTGFHFEEGWELLTVDMSDAPVILILLAAAMAAEVFLALKKDGRLGLILPGLWLLQSVVKLAVWMVQVSRYSSLSARSGDLCLAVLVENISTLLLLIVYGLCRLCKRWKTEQQLKKTCIEDL